jgi:hypothetical protein
MMNYSGVWFHLAEEDSVRLTRVKEEVHTVLASMAIDPDSDGKVLTVGFRLDPPMFVVNGKILYTLPNPSSMN